jgi:branched-chain amino acid transport system substrate-binding protein
MTPGASDPSHERETSVLKPNRTFTTGAALAALAVTSLTACGSDGEGDSSGEPITIAVITTLSGGSAQLGIESRNGARLAVDQINADGGIDGRDLELKEYDGQLQPEVVVRSATRADSVDGAVAIIGPHSTGEALALGPVSARLEIPFITPSAATTEVTVDQPYAFRTTVVNRELATSVVEFALADGSEKPALLHDNGGFGVAFAADLEAGLEEQGVAPVASEEFPVNATDMTAQIQKIKNSGADSVLLGCSGGNDAGLAYRQMVDAGLDVPVYGSSCVIQGDAIRVGEGAIKELPGVYGLAGFDTTKDKAKQFIEDYNAEFDEAATYEYSSAAYDGVMMLAEALKATDGEGGEALKTALEEVTEYDPVDGKEGATAGFGPDKHDALSGDYLTPYRIAEDGTLERVTE